MKIWSADVGNAYLNSDTNEKVEIRSGDEFGVRQGHTLIIQRALYGLESSGIHWWEHLSEVLREMGFQPSLVEDDIWMRKGEISYEYLAQYVDDLSIISHSSDKIITTLEGRYGYNLKGVGPITYHLGFDFFRDKENVLCMTPITYIKRMVDMYILFFGKRHGRKFLSPLSRGDYPELYDTEFLDINGIQMYHSLVGAGKLEVSLGLFDISTAIMTMNKIRTSHRKGHLGRVKRIYGHL